MLLWTKSLTTTDYDTSDSPPAHAVLSTGAMLVAAAMAVIVVVIIIVAVVVVPVVAAENRMYAVENG